jgi:DNA helicase II / ATP-dependent DNA helicase PcrA
VKKLTLSVAGGRKTQAIVDECALARADQRILVLTFTLTNQAELRSRLMAKGPLAARVQVMGWFSFLLGHWVRPYLPLRFPGRRLGGLNFEGDPGRYATDAARFLDGSRRAYRRHLPHLARDVCDASEGAVIDRLARIYDTIYIDEVQDLNGYDLEILDTLLSAPLDLNMVGDIRQAILATNPREQKNRQYRGIAVKKWFEHQAQSGRMAIVHMSDTWRCNQQIADFADSIFDPAHGFVTTVSHNTSQTGHDGVFVIAQEDAADYVETCDPLCLRRSAASARGMSLPFVNIGVAKGRDVKRVMIWPTAKMTMFLRTGTMLEDLGACELYVAVTRARASVAFVVKKPQDFKLPVWRP